MNAVFFTIPSASIEGIAPHPSWHNTRWLKSNPWFEAELLPLLRAEMRKLLKSAPAALRVPARE